MRPNLQEEEIEAKIGILFRNKDFLHRALIHRSFLNENRSEKFSNERLEFLGDAVLEFVVSRHLYQEFPDFPEGKLTALRAKLVNTTSLANTAGVLGLGQALYLSKGEEAGNGRENTGLLANTLEAIIGALYLDQGVSGVQVLIDKFILKKIPTIVREPLKDVKSSLQELVQASGLPAPSYKTVKTEGPDHAKRFTVQVYIDKKPYAHGVGLSKQVAAQEAAKEALKQYKSGKEDQ